MIKVENSGTSKQRAGKFIVYDTNYKGATYATFPYNGKAEKQKALDQVDAYIRELVEDRSTFLR